VRLPQPGRLGHTVISPAPSIFDADSQTGWRYRSQ
jgi:hypothetical protein